MCCAPAGLACADLVSPGKVAATAMAVVKRGVDTPDDPMIDTAARWLRCSEGWRGGGGG